MITLTVSIQAFENFRLKPKIAKSFHLHKITLNSTSVLCFFVLFCCWILVLVSWQAFISSFSYEAGFYKPTVLKLHPPLCRITAHATVPRYFSTILVSFFWSKLMVHDIWSLQRGRDSNSRPLGHESSPLPLDHSVLPGTSVLCSFVLFIRQLTLLCIIYLGSSQ